MLAPSYYKSIRQRQRGISLSRTSSLQKFNQSQNQNINHMRNKLNQSFECFEPTSNISLHEANLNQSIMKQNCQNRLSIQNKPINMNQKNKYQSYINNSKSGNSNKKPNMNYSTTTRSVLHPSYKHNILINPSSILNKDLDNYKYESNKKPSQFPPPTQQSVNYWQLAQTSSQMINLLTQYEKQCRQNMDLSSAEQARKRINELKKQQITNKKKQIQGKNQQYTLRTKRQGQSQLQQFNDFWSHKLQEAQQALDQILHKHLQQQQKQLQQYEKLVNAEPLPRVKFSSKVLQLRRNLSSLIKSRKYKQAEHLKSILQKKQIEEQEKFQILCQQKKIVKIKEFKKKQSQQLEAFKIKLNSSMNELIKNKEKQQEIMMKKMKKKEVQANKIPAELLRAYRDLANQSKAKIDKEDY